MLQGTGPKHFYLRITYRPRIAVETPVYGDGNGSPPLCETEYINDPDHPHQIKMLLPLPDTFFSPEDVDYDGTVDPAHPKIQVLVERPDMIIKARVIANNIKPFMKGRF